LALAQLTEVGAKAAAKTPPRDEVATEFARVMDLSEDNRSFASHLKNVCEHIARWDEVFDRVAKLRPKETALWVGRGQYRALREQWHQAASDLARVVRDRRLEDDSTFEYAGLLILDGDLEGYKKFCQELKVRLDRQPKDPWAAYVTSRVFAIGPTDAVDAPHVVEWAQQASHDNPTAFCIHNLGLAQYRAGQNEAAIENLQKATALGWGDGAALDWFVQAMIHDRLGHKEEANRCVEKAKELIKMAQPSGGDNVGIPCPDWIELNVLMREAEKVLQLTPQSHDASSGSENGPPRATDNKSAIQSQPPLAGDDLRSD
jgi:tetratricopeptide (TPR) repeat protein